MTSLLSPRDLLTAYCHNARAVAAAAGVPQPRSAFPGLPVKTTALVYLRETKLMFQPVSEPAAVLTPELFTSALVTEESSIVVADLMAFNRLSAIADAMPDEDFGTMARRLRIIRGLERSVKMPLLTEALTYRYWLPDTMDETSLDDWITAFGIAAPSTSLKIKALVSLALKGDRVEALNYPKMAQSMESLEQRILHNANWSGISTDCYVYQMLESAKTKATTLRLLDPALLEMHAIDGQVCQIFPTNVTDLDFTSSVSEPFKLKEGTKVRMTNGQSKALVEMKTLHYGAGTLQAEFATPSNRGTGRAMLAAAHMRGEALYVMEEPFAGQSKAPETKRWLGGDAPKITPRNVPLDVLLAGASNG